MSKVLGQAWRGGRTCIAFARLTLTLGNLRTLAQKFLGELFLAHRALQLMLNLL